MNDFVVSMGGDHEVLCSVIKFYQNEVLSNKLSII